MPRLLLCYCVVCCDQYPESFLLLNRNMKVIVQEVVFPSLCQNLRLKPALSLLCIHCFSFTALKGPISENGCKNSPAVTPNIIQREPARVLSERTITNCERLAAWRLSDFLRLISFLFHYIFVTARYLIVSVYREAN